MNEEIKKQISKLSPSTYLLQQSMTARQLWDSGIFEDFKADLYLQGAKDMRDAVAPANEAEASWIAGFDRVYHRQIIDVFYLKAQQFIDSLGRNDNGTICGVCSKG